MDKKIIEQFTDWMYAQSSPKSEADKKSYINSATKEISNLLNSFQKKYPGVSTLPEAPLPCLFDSLTTLKDLKSKDKTIINKCISFRVSLEEEISPSAEKTNDGLCLYNLISAIHRYRDNKAQNAYNQIISALLLLSPEEFPTDRADDLIRPEKSEKYKLYRHIMLFNLVNRFPEVTKMLDKALCVLSSADEKETLQRNHILTYPEMIHTMASSGKELLSTLEDKEGFKDSPAHYLIRQLAASSDASTRDFSYDNNLSDYFAVLIAKIALIALNNQGMGFSGDRLPLHTNEEDEILFSLLAPFSESLTVKLVGDAKLLENKSIKRLIYMGLLYPATVKGSKHPRLISAGGYESSLPNNKDGISFLSKIKNYPEMEKALHALLSEIYKAQKSELCLLFENRAYKIDRGLFTFPKELVTLLAASREEDVTDTGNTRFDTLLTSILAVSHWVNLRLFLLASKERYESGKRLSALISFRPVTASRAIGSLPDFPDKLADASAKDLLFNKKKENLLLAKVKLTASCDALDVAKAALGAENTDFAEYYITSALNFARDSKDMFLSLKDKLNAAFASAVCAEGYAYRALAKCRTNSATMLIADCIIPASKNLSEAEGLIEESEASDENILSVIRNNHFDTVSFVNETFYADNSPIYKVLAEDSDIKIPFTLSYEALKEHTESFRLDEIPDKVKSMPAIFFPHIKESTCFFKPFYITDFDSEITARKNLTADSIQPLLMKTVLSGNTVRLTANQIADNTEILKLCDSHGFLTLLQKGFISLSLYSTVKNLTDYVIRSLANPKFIFSSLPALNYDKDNTNVAKIAEIKKLRDFTADFILGKKASGCIPSSIREDISVFKERILRFDENFPTASKYYNYQRPSGNPLTLPEQFTAFFSARKNLTRFAAPYKIHETIIKYLSENYNRSEYKDFIDKIKSKNFSNVPINDRDKSFLCSFSNSKDTMDIMTDILTECHNTVLGSAISPNIHYTYRGSDKLILCNDYTTSFSDESKTAYNDIITVEETGETVDFDAMASYLSYMEVKIRENKSSFAEDKLAYSLDAPALSYSVSDKGNLLLNKASLLTTENRSISVTNVLNESEDSVLHIEKGRTVKI